MKEDESVVLNKDYWTNRWEEGQTGWDIGDISTPFLGLFNSLSDKSSRILIPGCGNGYEGEYLWKSGFTDVFILDISDLPLQKFLSRNPDFPQDHLLCMDFFDLNEKFDMVLEQTFFCALDPTWRARYVKKMAEIIHPGGKLTGLLFNFPLTKEGPPFGGSIEEYTSLFTSDFEIVRLEESKDSIKPRQGRELWFEFRRKVSVI